MVEEGARTAGAGGVLANIDPLKRVFGSWSGWVYELCMMLLRVTFHGFRTAVAYRCGWFVRCLLPVSSLPEQAVLSEARPRTLHRAKGTAVT